MPSLDNKFKFLRTTLNVIALAILLSSGSIGIAYSQEADADSSASAGASSGDGSSDAGSDSSASASAGPDGSGVTARSEAQTSGSATGGDTSVSEPGIFADASATSGDSPTATTSTSAGTSATSTAGNYKSVYADGGTVISREGRNRGYAIAYQDGAYSAAYYRGDTASATSGIYSGETLTKKDARSIIRSQVKAGAYANRTEAAAWASAGTFAAGTLARRTSSASTNARAFAYAGTNGTAFGSADARFSAAFGVPNTNRRAKLRSVKLRNCSWIAVRRSDYVKKCSRR